MQTTSCADPILSIPCPYSNSLDPSLSRGVLFRETPLTETVRTCTRCLWSLSPGAFERDRSVCKVCRHLISLYGMTRADKALMAKGQNHRCGACAEKTDLSKLEVDHDHKTDRVRSLLCRTCNAMLGVAHDDADRLLKGAKYLLSHGWPSGATVSPSSADLL